MENKLIRNTIKALVIYPIVLMLLFPLFYFFNDMTLKQTYEDMFKNFWK